MTTWTSEKRWGGARFLGCWHVTRAVLDTRMTLEGKTTELDKFQSCGADANS